MDYATIPSLASGMLRNFMDCALTLSFNSRHVAKLHGLPNDGCQVPRSGQARVTPQQTDDPRTKLGYDR